MKIDKKNGRINNDDTDRVFLLSNGDIARESVSHAAQCLNMSPERVRSAMAFLEKYGLMTVLPKEGE